MDPRLDLPAALGTDIAWGNRESGTVRGLDGAGLGTLTRALGGTMAWRGCTGGHTRLCVMPGLAAIPAAGLAAGYRPYALLWGGRAGFGGFPFGPGSALDTFFTSWMLAVAPGQCYRVGVGGVLTTGANGIGGNGITGTLDANWIEVQRFGRFGAVAPLGATLYGPSLTDLGLRAAIPDGHRLIVHSASPDGRKALFAVVRTFGASDESYLVNRRVTWLECTVTGTPDAAGAGLAFSFALLYDSTETGETTLSDTPSGGLSAASTTSYTAAVDSDSWGGTDATWPSWPADPVLGPDPRTGVFSLGHASSGTGSGALAGTVGRTLVQSRVVDLQYDAAGTRQEWTLQTTTAATLTSTAVAHPPAGTVTGTYTHAGARTYSGSGSLGGTDIEQTHVLTVTQALKRNGVTQNTLTSTRTRSQTVFFGSRLEAAPADGSQFAKPLVSQFAPTADQWSALTDGLFNTYDALASGDRLDAGETYRTNNVLFFAGKPTPWGLTPSGLAAAPASGNACASYHPMTGAVVWEATPVCWVA